MPSLWINIGLYIATLASTLFAGAFQATGDFTSAVSNLYLGLPFSLSLMAILTAHELGHYFASRAHGVTSSLPYFLPVPHPLVGTFGAFIRMRDKIHNRRALLDIGCAGPFCGVLVAIPLMFVGLRFSTVVPLSEVVGKQAWPLLGGGLFFKLTAYSIHGILSPEQGLQLHPIAYASWIGLWVTSINLIPIGQLDGGHIAYALFGRYHGIIARVAFVGMLVLGLLWMGWLFWALLTMLVVRFGHPAPADDKSPLDWKRKVLGVIALVIFIGTFLPVPFF
jgi:membrane-associated protease RseP (regulator of RpoE activity)